METIDDIYENLPSGPTLYEDIEKLQQENAVLQDLIRSLEADIEKLCATITEMKKTQENLTKNISELYKTAKAEISRKDRIISELRNELEQLHRRNYKIPFKRNRDSSPSFNNSEDPGGKRRKYDDENPHASSYNTGHYGHSRSASKPKEAHRTSRDRSRERGVIHTTFDKYKLDNRGKHNVTRADKILPRNNYKPNLVIRRVSDFRESDKNERKESGHIIDYSMAKPISKAENRKEIKENAQEKHLKDAKNDPQPKPKTEPDNAKNNNSKSALPEKPAISISINKSHEEIIAVTACSLNEKTKVEDVSKTQRVKESKRKKSKIAEVTKKLFERLEEEAKQGEQVTTCPVSVSLNNITEVPQKVEKRNSISEFNDELVNSDEKVEVSVIEDKIHTEESKITEEKHDATMAEFIKKEKEHATNLIQIFKDKPVEDNKTSEEGDEKQDLNTNMKEENNQLCDNEKHIIDTNQNQEENLFDGKEELSTIIDEKESVLEGKCDFDYIATPIQSKVENNLDSKEEKNSVVDKRSDVGNKERELPDPNTKINSENDSKGAVKDNKTENKLDTKEHKSLMADKKKIDVNHERMESLSQNSSVESERNFKVVHKEPGKTENKLDAKEPKTAIADKKKSDLNNKDQSTKVESDCRSENVASSKQKTTENKLDTKERKILSTDKNIDLHHKKMEKLAENTNIENVAPPKQSKTENKSDTTEQKSVIIDQEKSDSNNGVELIAQNAETENKCVFKNEALPKESKTENKFDKNEQKNLTADKKTVLNDGLESVNTEKDYCKKPPSKQNKTEDKSAVQEQKNVIADKMESDQNHDGIDLQSKNTASECIPSEQNRTENNSDTKEQKITTDKKKSDSCHEPDQPNTKVENDSKNIAPSKDTKPLKSLFANKRKPNLVKRRVDLLNRNTNTENKDSPKNTETPKENKTENTVNSKEKKSDGVHDQNVQNENVSKTVVQNKAEKKFYDKEVENSDKKKSDIHDKKEAIPNSNVSEKANKDTKRTISPATESKSKKIKDSTKKDSKSKITVASLLKEESDRVLRSASRRNSVKEKAKKSIIDEVDSKDEQKKSEKPIFCPKMDLTGSFSVNLSHDGEIPVLHIEDCANSQVKSIFGPLFNDQSGFKDVSPLENNSSVITSSPVSGTPSKGVEVKDLQVVLTDLNDNKQINGMPSSHEVSHTDSNLSISISSVNTSTNSVEKVFNTSSARKRRRVILKMVD